MGHDADHFTSPEGIPGIPETNFNNRPNSFKVLSPPRTCVVRDLVPFNLIFRMLKKYMMIRELNFLFALRGKKVNS